MRKTHRFLSICIALVFIVVTTLTWIIPVKADSPEPVIFSADGTITREYKWKYDNREWTWNLTVTEAQYKYFKNLDRLKTSDYSYYVSSPYDDAYIKSLVSALKEAQVENRFSKRQLVDFTVAFVQSLPYYFDLDSTGYDNYAKYPLETLVDNGGDCEDTSILMVSLLKEMGYGTVLLLYPKHMAVGVKGTDEMPGTFYEFKGSKYFYLETTGDGWTIGKMPISYKDKKVIITTLEQKPLITSTWKITSVDGDKIKVNIKNSGTKEADKCKVYIAFDAGNGKVYNPKNSDYFRVGIGEDVSCELNIKYPKKVKTRVIIKIYNHGELLNTSYSKWFTRN